MCNCPITAYYHPTEKTVNGKRKIVFKPPYEQAPKLELPCGRCIACRLEKTRQWGLRAEHEAKFYDENCFVTLTYKPEQLPETLEKRPLQLFIKRLRKYISPTKIKYIASGELGDNYDNPHYHICVFGWMPKDLQFLYNQKGADYYTSPLIENLWKDEQGNQNGFIVVTDLNFATARYTSKYAIKKELGSKEKTRPAEFFVCSQGVGKAHVDKYSKDMAEKGTTYANNHSCKLPRYYKNKIKESENKNILEITLDKLKKISIKNPKNRFEKEVIKRKEILQTSEDQEIIRQRELNNKMYQQSLFKPDSDIVAKIKELDTLFSR